MDTGPAPYPARARGTALAVLICLERAHISKDLAYHVLSMLSFAFHRRGQLTFRLMDNIQNTTVVNALPCRSWAWVLARYRELCPCPDHAIVSVTVDGWPLARRRYLNGRPRVLRRGLWVDVADDHWHREWQYEAWIVGNSLRPLAPIEAAAVGLVYVYVVLPGGKKLYMDLPRESRVLSSVVSRVHGALRKMMPKRPFPIYLAATIKGKLVGSSTTLAGAQVQDYDEIDVYLRDMPWIPLPPVRPGAQRVCLCPSCAPGSCDSPDAVRLVDLAV